MDIKVLVECDICYKQSYKPYRQYLSSFMTTKYQYFLDFLIKPVEEIADLSNLCVTKRGINCRKSIKNEDEFKQK